MSSNSSPSSSSRLPNVILIGTGEYTTGYVHDSASSSDKACGVIALTCFDLRARGLIGETISLVGTNGTKFPAIRRHLHDLIYQRYQLDTTLLTYPDDSTSILSSAYEIAITKHHQAGDIAIVTTPDSTHFKIAKYCMEQGLHVMIAKPIVQNLSQHQQLVELSLSNQVLCGGEFHKRYDPLYFDASTRIKSGKLGLLSHFSSYMSQPKSQLKTFSNWLKSEEFSSDISYYLNAHHIDFLCNAIVGKGARASVVIGMGALGTANEIVTERKRNIEDTITLNVTFDYVGTGKEPEVKAGGSESETVVKQDLINATPTELALAVVSNPALVPSSSSSASESSSTSSSSSRIISRGIASFTSSWVAPRSDVHSQQRFHFLGSIGEINIDQAHRGYNSANDSEGYQSRNPLFMRYEPSENGRFVGQDGYGYRSLEKFVEGVKHWKQGRAEQQKNGVAKSAELYGEVVTSRNLAVVDSIATMMTTAILEAGRMSLDAGMKPVRIEYDSRGRPSKLVLQ